MYLVHSNYDNMLASSPMCKHSYSTLCTASLPTSPTGKALLSSLLRVASFARLISPAGSSNCLRALSCEPPSRVLSWATFISCSGRGTSIQPHGIHLVSGRHIELTLPRELHRSKVDR